MKPVMAAAAFLLLSLPAHAQVSVIQADYEEVITDLEGRARFTEIGRHTFDELGRHRRDWTTLYGESVSEIVLPERNERLAINHETRTIAVWTVRRQLLLPVVLPQLRMLPAILRMIVPAISDESRAAAPTAGSRPPGVPPGRRARRGTGRAPDPDPDNPSHLVNRRGRPGHPGPPRRSITSPMHY
ncbi:MAG: hypothetical protein F4Y14_14310 [Acidobacteria bacterium]|nr:hypothetical protein [Acidobacteriota bacterium]